MHLVGSLRISLEESQRQKRGEVQTRGGKFFWGRSESFVGEVRIFFWEISKSFLGEVRKFCGGGANFFLGDIQKFFGWGPKVLWGRCKFFLGDIQKFFWGGPKVFGWRSESFFWTPVISDIFVLFQESWSKGEGNYWITEYKCLLWLQKKYAWGGLKIINAPDPPPHHLGNPESAPGFGANWYVDLPSVLHSH